MVCLYPFLRSPYERKLYHYFASKQVISLRLVFLVVAARCGALLPATTAFCRLLIQQLLTYSSYPFRSVHE